MRLVKMEDFNNIYYVDSFPDDLDALFGKNKGQKKVYMKWLYQRLETLDAEGRSALQYEQFEQLNCEAPALYSIRHPQSKINERYIYVYFEQNNVILLTALKEKNRIDYEKAIKRSHNILIRLEEEE